MYGEKILQAINKNVAPCRMLHKLYSQGEGVSSSSNGKREEVGLGNQSQNVHWLCDLGAVESLPRLASGRVGDWASVCGGGRG